MILITTVFVVIGVVFMFKLTPYLTSKQVRARVAEPEPYSFGDFGTGTVFRIRYGSGSGYKEMKQTTRKI
jgi:hypothetical protein